MNHQRNRFPSIERLESRQLLAGNITAAVVGEDLVIIGDDLANSLSLETTSQGVWALTGKFTDVSFDTTINGLDTEQSPVVFTGVTGNLVVQLGGGDDRFFVYSFNTALAIHKAFILDTGVGNDSVRLIPVGGAQIQTQFFVELGDGHDSLSAVNVGTGTDIVIRGGVGNDSISLSFVSSRDLAIHSGEGFDAVRIEGCQIRNSTLLDGGSDADRLEIQSSDLANDSAIFGRQGGDAIFVNFARPKKTFFISGGGDFAYIEIRQSLLGTHTYVINEGPTQVDIDGSQFKRLEVFVGAQGDSVSITRSSADELFASLGEASDSFKLIATRVNQRGRIDGQGGFDVFLQGDNVVMNLEMVGFEYFPPPQSFMQP